MSVYVLVDPRTDRPRYVGRSVRPKVRFHQHLCQPHSQALRDWIQELRAAGMVPELRLLVGSTEREWILRLAPDLNVARGVDENDPYLPINLTPRPGEKAAFIRAANQARQSLSQWILQAAVERAEKQGLRLDPAQREGSRDETANRSG